MRKTRKNPDDSSMLWLVGIVGGGALLAKSGKANAAEAPKSTLPTSDQVADAATEVAQAELTTSGAPPNSPSGAVIINAAANAASKVMTSDMLINMTVNGVTDDTRIAAVRIPATFRKATTAMTTQQAASAQAEQQAQNNDWASIISSLAVGTKVYAMQQKQEAKIAALVASPYNNYGYVYDPPLDKLPDLPSTKSTYTYRWEFVPLKTEYSGKWIPQPVYVQKTVQPVSTPLVDVTKPAIPFPVVLPPQYNTSMVPAGPQPEPVPGIHRVTNRLSDRESSYFKQTQVIEDIYLPAKPATSSVTQEWYFQNDGINASGDGVWIVVKQQVNY